MKLLIFAGKGKDFGTGHETRMQDLQSLLDPKSPLPSRLANSQNKVSQELGQSVRQFTKQTKLKTVLCTFNKTEEAFQELAKINKNPKGADTFLFLLDAREMDPYPFLEKGSALTLDNYHSVRYAPQNKLGAQKPNKREGDFSNRVIFHDSLPHPYSCSASTPHFHSAFPSPAKGELEQIIEQALISPYLLDRASKVLRTSKGSSISKITKIYRGQISIQKKALFCAGPFEELPDLFHLFSRLIQNRTKENSKLSTGQEQDICLEEILWLGKKSKDRRLWSFTSFKERMPRLEFWDHLSTTQILFCYPGMALLEACFLGKRPILFATESRTHNELSAYLEEKAGLIYLRNKKDRGDQEDEAKLKGTLNQRKGFAPSGRGYTILFAKTAKP